MYSFCHFFCCKYYIYTSVALILAYSYYSDVMINPVVTQKQKQSKQNSLRPLLASGLFYL